MISISTFNVNSIRARLPRFLEWLEKSKPDIVLLQEIKCLENDFPFEEISNRGYNIAIHGQKTYNGVAIISKFRIEEVYKNIPSFNDEQSRYIEAIINVKNKIVRVSSIYVPNGGDENLKENFFQGEKFIYKMNFLNHLKNHIYSLLKEDEIQIFGGDFNVAIEEIDCFDSKVCEGKLLFHQLERQKMRSLINSGLIDSFRVLNPNNKKFSWFDYRGEAWKNNKGFRIDYILLSPLASDLLVSCDIEDVGVRDQEKCSDHCPVSVCLDI